MRKLLILLLLIVVPFQLFAFTISDFEAKKVKYVKLIETKLSNKLSKLSNKKLESLVKLVDKRITKTEDSEKLSDNSKLKNLALLYALKEVILKIPSKETSIEDSSIVIKIIDDKRCNDCNVNLITEKLKELPFLESAKYINYDYSDIGMKDYLETNGIKFLPAIVFSNNDFKDPDNSFKTYLVNIKSWEYSLQVWSRFDPLVKRSEKWFMILDSDKLKDIKENSYIKWNTDAKITWLEYSDIECPFCARLHNSSTPKDLKEKYWDKLNYVFNHFPLAFHKNAQVWAEILECSWAEKGWEVFYSLLDKTFSESKSDIDFLIEEAVKLWASKTKLEACLKDWIFSDKVDNQMKFWADTFGITWTPWSVLINNETWEYEILSWAYPTTNFEKIIDSLLK